MRYRVKIFAVAAVCALILLACVKTEKRTSRKVDASNVTVYEYDPSKPGIRVALEFPGDMRTDLANRFYVEIDDGENRYGFPGSACAGDSAADTVLHSPRLNTPGDGQVFLKFLLAGPGGEDQISDSVTMALLPDQHWQVSFGIYAEDPCREAVDLSECRAYPLSESPISGGGDWRLFMIWRGYPVSPAGGQ